jgi:phosphatidylinositol alpha-mannosyltransferase
LEAVASLPECLRHRIELTIIGEGPLRVDLMRAASDLGISTQSDFRGQVSEAEKISILQRSDLAIFPATGGESFGMVLLEAIGCGAVVLAFDNAGYRYVLRDSPMSLVPNRNTTVLSDRIAYLMRNAPALRLLRSNQNKAIEQYDLDRIGSQYLELYQER